MRNQANVLGDSEMAMPGDGVKLSVSLQRPIALADGDRQASQNEKSTAIFASHGKLRNAGVPTR